MHGGAAGIREQVEEIFAFAHLTEHTTGDAVIEEQTSIEIIRQVHPQVSVIFGDFEKLALLAQFLVLIFALLAFTGFQHQFVWRNPQYRNGCSDNIEQTLTRFVSINSFWRRILLHHHPVGITINGNVIFRQIGVIQAVTFNPFLVSPLLEFFEVLTQAVSVVFRYHRRFAVWSAFGNVVIFLYAVQRAVFRLVLFVCTQLQAA